jgi:tetratricopeptide (TPR) repeat protein
MNRFRLWSLVRLWVAALGIVTMSCSRDPIARARKFVEQGDAYMARGQFKEAALEYRNAAKVRKDWAEAYYKRGRAYLSLNDPVHAYQAYSRAADLDPSNIDAQLQAGALLLAAGEYEAARARAHAALQKGSKNAGAHILLGDALAGLKDKPRALREIEEAIALESCRLDRCQEFGILPGVHRRPVNVDHTGECRLQRGDGRFVDAHVDPDGAENHRHVERPRRCRQRPHIELDHTPVELENVVEHVVLIIDQQNRALGRVPDAAPFMCSSHVVLLVTSP